MQGYVPGEDGAFGESRKCFGELEDWLASEEAAGLQHGELEEQLDVRGRALLRQLFQDRLDLTAAREERRDDVTGPDGVVRTRADRGRTRPLVTRFGQVTVSRVAYRSPGRSNVHLLDAALNLPGEKHSHGLRKLAAVEAARGSIEAAGAAVVRATGVRIGKRQLEELARRAAVDVEAFYLQRVIDPVPDGWPLVLTFDGKGIVMLPDALRPATARAAAAAKGKLATRLSPGEKNGRKRMAELACVYDAGPVPRTPEEVISTPAQKRRKNKAQARKPKGKGKPREPQARGKWLTASVTDDIPAVIAAAFDEAQRRDPQHKREWPVLIDGNNTQIEAVTSEAGRRGVTITVVIDFIHVLEYLWKAAWSFFDKGEPAAEEWVADQARKILRGNSAQVAAGIRRRATTYGYSPAERAGADEAARYLDNKKDYLGYATALEKGWPIATGVIEGAARWLVKDRMDITGARWGLEGAEAILKLRALIASGDFDAYWRFHLRREHERIHHARYRDGVILAA
ncbi:MAG TPA: ISKra4 family transposase [Streptosporangiaceae bacterium]|nr:ISKra4 family transposase [Streptosporangiaceae bacterium]